MLSRFSRVQLFVTLWTIARQAPLSMGFSRQEYWSMLSCPSPGDLPTQDQTHISCISCTAGIFFTHWTTWEAHSISISSVQLLSRVRLCNPMNRSTPGLSVHHHLPKFTQTHVHRVCDAIQPSHPLLSPSPPAPNPSQHQSFFWWVNSLHEVAKVLEFQL